MRLSGRESVEGRLTIQVIKVIAPVLEEADLDMVHISVGVYLFADDNATSSSCGHSYFLNDAAEIKKLLKSLLRRSAAPMILHASTRAMRFGGNGAAISVRSVHANQGGGGAFRGYTPVCRMQRRM